MMAFENYKKGIIRIARQLGYSRATIRALKNAQTETECTRIMCTAREHSEIQ